MPAGKSVTRVSVTARRGKWLRVWEEQGRDDLEIFPVGKKFDHAAALHLAAGAIKDQEVPVGNHDLSNVQLILTFPDFCAVVRGPGSMGDGFDELAAPSPAKALTLAATLLFLARCQPAIVGDQARALWAECIAETIERGSKPDDFMPREAIDGLEIVQAATRRSGDEITARRRTPAKRVGAEGVAIDYKRLAKPKAKAKA